ncbi:MAG TPA: M23 family metallopeptidase [Candidatus Rifleibacterium sp.]|nr:M23 family metallopeptidase [Candidatus Rifleibacterium sp.]
MKPLVLVLLTLVLCPVCFAGDEPLWPLAIEISQSSSFAEFRGMRFHAGIDLRTQQKNGFPVRAIADGFISRASVQFRGYGYALYIDHPELKTRVVYGHLQDFSGPIKEYIAAKLKKMQQRHGINDFFTADRFPVKKGQIVALSGDTGMGPSHLHFEMRTLADEPLAPALFGYRPADHIFPDFHYFYLLPFAHQTVIDDSFLPARYRLQASGRHTWQLAEVPQVDGKIAMQAGVSDTNGAGNRFGIEKLTLTSAGKVVLERIFHQYSYDDNRQCPWVYDYFKSNEKNTGYVCNLFKLPFETLPMAKQYPAWAGCFASSEFAGGKLDFAVTGIDFGNNSIQAEGVIRAQQHDFSARLAADRLAEYQFGEVFQTDYSFIAIGTRKKSAGSVQSEYGLVTLTDKAGKSADIACILNSGRAELAFPKEQRWQSGAWLNDRRLLPETQFIERQGGVVNLEAGASAEFPDGSLNFPIFAALRKAQSAPTPGGNAKRGWLKPHSAIWHLTPDDVVFNSEATIRITPDAFSGDIHKLGIYEVDAGGGYSHNGEKFAGGSLSFTARTGGKYVILQDLLPPVLSYSHQTSHYHLGKCYVFKASDLGKGIEWLSATARVNDEAVEVYSDPDKAEIYVVRPQNGLPHKIILKINDQAGNSAEITKKIQG